MSYLRSHNVSGRLLRSFVIDLCLFSFIKFNGHVVQLIECFNCVIVLLRANYTGLMDDPVAQRWNSSSIDFAEITMDRNFALLLVSLISAILWIVYITYYNSRVLGYILTRLINKFYFQDDNFKIGE